MKKDNHDADYDRWGSAPGAIRVKKRPARATNGSTSKKKGKKK